MADQPRRRSLTDLDSHADALLGFVVVGPTLVALASVGANLIYRSVYGNALDVLVHIAVAAASNALVGLFLWPLLYVAWRASRFLFQIRPWLRRAYAVVVMGGLAVLLHRFVIVASAYNGKVPLWAVVVILGCGGAAATELSLRVLRKQLMVLIVPVLALAAVSLEGFCVVRFVRFYGNLHVIVTVGILIAAGFAATTFIENVQVARRAGFAMGGVLLVGTLLLALHEPSNSNRIAVLQYGGTEKLLIRHVLWPLTDRDGDGASAIFWGMDQNDADPNVKPTGRKASGTSSAPSVRPPFAPVRSIAWVLIDTLRTDTFDQVLHEPNANGALANFTDLRGYRSCGSRTDTVLNQLFGPDGCKSNLQPDGALATLRDHGYEDIHFGPLATGPTFKERRDLEVNDVVALETAGAFIRNRSSARPAFVFVHLLGGHDHERAAYDVYVQNVRALVAPVVAFADAVPKDWLVVIMGDHGEEFGEHGGSHHAGTLYEEVLRTPALVREPSDRDRIASAPPNLGTMALGCNDLSDFLLRSLEAGPPRHPVLSPDQSAPQQFAMLDLHKRTQGALWDMHMSSARFGDIKVVTSSDLGTWEIFDMVRDPGETQNLALHDSSLISRYSDAIATEVARCPIYDRPGANPYF